MRIPKGDLRTAFPASIRLGMKPAVGGIFVFFPTGSAHGEVPHGGVGSIIREGFEDGESRAAMGAVGEGVKVAAVSGIKDLLQTSRAGCQVGEDPGLFGAGFFAGSDGEGSVADGWEMDRFDRGIDHMRRPILVKSRLKGLKGRGRSFDFNDDALGTVEDIAG